MIHKSLFILGRQPAIGRAELESLLGSNHVEPIGDSAAASDISPENIPFDRIGSSIRLGRPVTVFPSTKWPDVAQLAMKELPGLIDHLPLDGKIKLGVSTFDMAVQPNNLLRTGLEFKKICKKAGRSARVVPNTETALNSAQVLHNQLTGNLGIELLFVKDGDKTHLAQTTAVQDIDAYARRDQGRPKRDAFVGMLPPKLAQTIVNLAVAGTPPSSDFTVLDPFCGTGVLLQESLLMGYGVYGTDLEPRMVDYTKTNIAWLLDNENSPQQSTDLRSGRYDASNALTDVGGPVSPSFPNDMLDTLLRKDLRVTSGTPKSATPKAGEPGSITSTTEHSLEVGDATDHIWNQKPINAVATETYLGHPLSNFPNPEKLQEIIGTCNVIIEKFLRNIAGQIKPGTRLCIAIPAWYAPNGRLYHLSLLDRLEVLGYNRVSFLWANAAELVYRRPEQIVARELLIITRK